MERRIGEIFEYNGEWYQCVGGTCRNCSFYYDTVCKNITTIGSTTIGNCHCSLRTDHKSVIFKKLEKWGKPYPNADKLYQLYILPMNIEKLPRTEGINLVRFDIVEIEIKQNKKDMEEKKDNYDGNMDKECISICDALNSIPDVHTVESCCGHCKDRFMIFLTCNNSHSLAIIARVFDRRYIGTSQPWYIELQTKDSGDYDYFIHSETKYDNEEVMMKDVNQIIENIKHWCDDKFASHFRGCNDKPTLAPFDINLAKQGKPVCTRDGRKARIICFDKITCKNYEELKIIALVREKDNEDIHVYNNNGKKYLEDSPIDLMMLSEKKEGWVNVYKEYNGISKYNCDDIVFNTKEEAIQYAQGYSNYITTVKIKWEE